MKKTIARTLAVSIATAALLTGCNDKDSKPDQSSSTFDKLNLRIDDQSKEIALLKQKGAEEKTAFETRIATVQKGIEENSALSPELEQRLAALKEEIGKLPGFKNEEEFQAFKKTLADLRSDIDKAPKSETVAKLSDELGKLDTRFASAAEFKSAKDYIDGVKTRLDSLLAAADPETMKTLKEVLANLRKDLDGKTALSVEDTKGLTGRIAALEKLIDTKQDKTPVAALSAGKHACTTAELSDIATPTPEALIDKNPAPAVVPGVDKWQGGSGQFSITAKSRVVIESAHAKALQPLAERLVADLAEITGLTLKVAADAQVYEGDIALSLSPCNEAVKTRIGNEGYTLSIGKAAILRGNIARGLHVDEDKKDYTNSVFYASRTLLQMLMLDGKPAKTHASAPQGYVVDIPLYKERSFMVDVGRGFVDKESLKAYMKFLGWYKINTLRMHLSDDLLDRAPGPFKNAKEGFRLYSHNPDFKNKQPLSADGLYYSRADWDELEDVAAANGIVIIPEIDTPGHATALVKAIRRLYPANRSTDNELYVSDPQTVAFIQAVWSEFLPWFKSKTVHIGVDESSANGQIKFINDMAKFFQGKDKVMQIWDDAVKNDTILEPNVVVEYWTKNKIPQSDRNWINSSVTWYANPNLGDNNYASSRGSVGDSFYADDKGLGIDHPHASFGPDWDWFGKTKALMSSPKVLAPLGGQIALWNDVLFHQPYTFEQSAHYHIKDIFPAAGQIWWNGQKKGAAGKLIPYSELRKSVVTLQYGPGVSDVAMFAKSPILSTIPVFKAENRPAYKITPAYPARDGVLTGLAKIYECKSCGADEVGYLGTFAGKGEGTVTLTVPVEKAGKYLLPIYYVGGVAGKGQLSVNGSQTPLTVNFPASGGGADTQAEGVTTDNRLTMLSDIDQQVIVGVFVDLKAGDNTFKFFNPLYGTANIGGLGVPLLQPTPDRTVAPSATGLVPATTVSTSTTDAVPPVCVPEIGTKCP
jgi:hexosaminidase